LKEATESQKDNEGALISSLLFLFDSDLQRIQLQIAVSLIRLEIEQNVHENTVKIPAWGAIRTIQPKMVAIGAARQGDLQTQQPVATCHCHHHFPNLVMCP
jgi:hypothetical protein